MNLNFCSFLALSTVFLLLISSLQTVLSNPLARGFGDDYDWVTLEEAKKLSASTKKPIMMIIHKSWCSACKGLKPKIAGSKSIKKLAVNFIMVNVEDDEEPKDPQFKVGSYVPKIIFLNSKGKVRKDVYNLSGNEKFKYFYSSPKQIIDIMRYAIEEITEEKDAVIEALEEEERLRAEQEEAEKEKAEKEAQDLKEAVKTARIMDEL